MVARYWSSERTVNTTTAGDQSFASAALMPNGSYLIAFTDNNGGAYEIRARLFGADGLAITNGVTGNSNDFQVNTTTALDQTYSAAAGLAGGGFVVAFQDFSGSDNNIRARIFTANGTPLGADFAVNTSTDYTQERPNVVGLAGGGFVVVYGDYSNNFNGNLADVRARLFAANGTPVVNGVTNDTNDFLVHASVGGNQLYPAVAALANGNFVVTYTDNSTFTINADIRARVFSPNGSPAGTEFTVNTTTASNQQQSAIAALTNGGFVVVFSDPSDPTPGYDREVRARLFDASGSAVSVNGSTNDFVVNTTHIGFQGTPSVAAAPDGGFLVTWQDDNGATDGVGQAIAGQLYDGAGSRVGTQFVVNQKAGDSQAEPCAIALGDGRILVTWHDDNTSKTDDLTSYAVRSVIIDPREGIVTGTSAADLLYGNDLLSDRMSGGAGNDTLWGLGGADILKGDGGADAMHGGAGNDVYYVDNASDQVIEAAGGGTDTVYASADFTLGVGQEIEKLIVRGSGGRTLGGNELANSLYGSTGSDTLNGGDGNDRLDGRAGADLMAGGNGNDICYVDNASDQVIEAAGGGTDTVYAVADFTLGVGQEIEKLRVDGSAARSLTGNSLTNYLIGGAGNDTLNGGAGNDKLQGSGGGDIFRFNTALGATNIDKILDYSVAADTIQLENAVFTGLAVGALASGAFFIGSAAQDADDRIVYNSATGALFFDSNGNGAGGSHQFATVAPGLAMTNSEFSVI